ncbi:MAG: hypothetical protein HY075_10280 [Deltaproteobacteria bacterium]|nr:hypothetical protein [Deltaproteobacteria bacterium]
MIKKVSDKLSKIPKRFFNDENEERFIAYARAKWPPLSSADPDSVVLIDMYGHYPLLQSYAASMNILGRLTNARLGAFTFASDKLSYLGVPHRRVERMFESFGAPVRLSVRNGVFAASDADRFAEEHFARLKTKWDVLDIKIDGFLVGDLVYDTYLRRGVATIDITDPALKKDLRDAYVIYRAVESYFAKNKVVAVLSGHTCYNAHGIITRYALTKGVPLLHMRRDTYLVELKDLLVDCPVFYLNKERFAKLAPDVQKASLARAKSDLERRLKGHIDGAIAYLATGGKSGLTGYGKFSDKRITKDTDKPKILVLLSCFFDAPHCFRSSKINFVTIKDSNKQLVSEGVRAMFTTYGTAGHEFAYMGVPTVNAGDNPHINYDFNLHPATVEEYKSYIYSADRLQVKMDKAQVEEFFVMHSYFIYDNEELKADPLTYLAKERGISEYSSEFLNLHLENERNGGNEKFYRYYEEFLSQYARK